MAKVSKKAASHQGIKVTKQMIPYESSTPENEPLFVNHFQVSNVGTDCYIDLGIVPLDDVLKQPAKGEARFLVLQRLVMGPQTLANLRGLIDEILTKMNYRRIPNA